MTVAETQSPPRATETKYFVNQQFNIGHWSLCEALMLRYSLCQRASDGKTAPKSSQYKQRKPGLLLWRVTLLGRIHSSYTAAIRKTKHITLKSFPHLWTLNHIKMYRGFWPSVGRTTYANIQRIVSFRIRRLTVCLVNKKPFCSPQALPDEVKSLMTGWSLPNETNHSLIAQLQLGCMCV